jgi:glycosyltransferase involved in cell wall biosynthesis
MNNSALRDELSVRGQERARMFSWQHTAEETLKIYTEVAQDRAGVPSSPKLSRV